MLVFQCRTKARQYSVDVVHPCLDRSRPVFDFAVDLEFLPRVTLGLNAYRRGREDGLVSVYPYSHAFACPRAERVGNITIKLKLATVVA